MWTAEVVTRLGYSRKGHEKKGISLQMVQNEQIIQWLCKKFLKAKLSGPGATQRNTGKIFRMYTMVLLNDWFDFFKPISLIIFAKSFKKPMSSKVVLIYSKVKFF